MHIEGINPTEPSEQLPSFSNEATSFTADPESSELLPLPVSPESALQHVPHAYAEDQPSEPTESSEQTGLLPSAEPLSDIPVLPDRQEYPRVIALISSLEVVRAVPADAEEIGLLRARNWKEQYAHLDGVTGEWMDAEVERIAGEEGTRSRAHWIERATQPVANNYWLIARTKNNALAGFLEARKHDDGTQELRSLHLAPAQRGAGIGQALLDAVHAEWFDPDAETFLDVAEVNEAGQRFYGRSPNNYRHTDHKFFYGPIAMIQMKREAKS